MSALNVKQALDRLNGLLPLKQRQACLPPLLRELHREILRSFYFHGQPLSRQQIAAQLQGDDVDGALRRLADDDLLVLAPDGKTIAGAYPFTLEQRAHRVTANGQDLRAMCALDALSVAPMFNASTRVDSRCHVQGVAIGIHMQNEEVLATVPEQPYVGIRWQGTAGCAAQSLCLEMVFLCDQTTAENWQAGDRTNSDIFTLPEAVAFGSGFFRPLLD